MGALAVIEDARRLFAEAAARQGLPETLEDPSAADRVALLILSKEV
jgi:hypothetical protein